MLYGHQFKYHGIKRHKCSFCRQTFNRKLELNEHLLTHISQTFSDDEEHSEQGNSDQECTEKIHKCHFCNQIFPTKHTLLCHLRSHTGINSV